MRIELRRFLWSGVLAVAVSTAGAVSPSYAQGTGDAGTPQGTTADVGERDDGMDWGWIGLLGLAGLLGLRGRDRVDTTRTRP